jgi:MFS family permease
LIHRLSQPAELSVSTSQRSKALILVGAVYVLFWGLPTLVTPFSADQYWFALGGRSILAGDQPYSDFADLKGPLIYLLYTVPMAIGGENVESIRLFDLANTLAAMVGVYFLTLRFFESRAALLASAVYGFAYLASVGTDGLAETESFMVAPLTLALALYPVRDDEAGGWLRAGLAGLLLGLAFGLKFSVFPLLLALPAMELILRRPGTWSWRGALQRLAIAAIAFLAVQAAWALYLLAVGSLDEFIDLTRNYTIPYQNFEWKPNDWSRPRFTFISTKEWLRFAWFLTVPAGLGLALTAVHGPMQRAYLFALLVVLAILSVWWQGKFFAYHWIVVLPVLAPLAGYALSQAVDAISGLPQPRALLAGVVLAAALVFMAADPLISTYDGYHYLADRISGRRTQGQIDAIYFPPLAQNQELADYVRANSTPDEALYIWGPWPQALFIADRKSATRFETNPWLRASWTPEAWRRELLLDLEIAPPRFIAVAAGDLQPWLTGTNETSDEHFCNNFPELRALVEQGYQPVLDNGLFVLYDRDAPAATVQGRC